MRVRLVSAVAAVLVSLSALSACGSDSGDEATDAGSGEASESAGSDADAETEAEREAEEEAEKEAAAGEGVCPDDATEVGVPADVADVPFPEGAVVYDVEEREGTGTILTAVSPEPMSDVLAAMNSSYGSGGYEITDGETEEHDAEANWTKGDVRGRWAIRDLVGSCAAGTQVQVLVAE